MTQALYLEETLFKEMEKKDIAYGAHVLVFPLPVQGHINPMLQFAKRLAFKGLKVTIATTIYPAKSLHIGTGLLEIEPLSDGQEGAAMPREKLLGLLTDGSGTLTRLIQKQEGSLNPFSCLVYDSIFPWALNIAKQLGLCGASFFTQSCAISAIYYHVNQGKLDLPPSATIISIPGLPQLRISDLPSFVSAPESYPSTLVFVLRQFCNLEKADWVLVNSLDKLEDEEVRWMEGLWPVKTIGPTLPSMYLDKVMVSDNDYGINLSNPNGEPCQKWLDTRPTASVVYVSFGSVANLKADQMEELAWGLKESNKNFLWVVRASEQSKLPKNFVEETIEKGLVVTWCPQLEVLAHSAVGCFVTHCGWNSTLEALSLGVPMVAVPQWTDQPTNAKYVEDIWGVGLRVKVGENGVVRREEMENCIIEVMEGVRGKEIKKNAGKWMEFAKEALAEDGSSIKNIDDFVAKLINK
ncbi:mogroside I-E synthase-like isoform X1 [Tasmannia lanceolata]|uniref:mogroside I-E synthase-like isoform X1 n=1 Tax=Tasmannia lanceolata TaxID=3420 RepID=UPI00406336B4